MSELLKVARHKHPFHVSRNERCSMLILTWKGFFLACWRSVDLFSASDSKQCLMCNTSCNCCDRMKQLVGCCFWRRFRSDRLKTPVVVMLREGSISSSYEVREDRICGPQMIGDQRLK